MVSSSDPNIIDDKILHFAVLDKFYMNEPYSSIFFKFDIKDQDLFQKNDKIQPYFKQGFNWNLFSTDLFKDTVINSIEHNSKVGRSSILKEAKSIRSAISQEQDTNIISIYKNRLKAIKDILIVINAQKDDVIDIYKNNKINNILNSFKKYISINVDHIELRDSLQCYFYEHPNLGEKGILCYFNNSFIPIGIHSLKIKRIRYLKMEAKDSTKIKFDTIKYTLPFIKIH